MKTKPKLSFDNFKPSDLRKMVERQARTIETLFLQADTLKAALRATLDRKKRRR